MYKELIYGNVQGISDEPSQLYRKERSLSLTSNFPLAPERTLCDWDTIRQNEKHQYLRQCCLVSLIYRNQNRS